MSIKKEYERERNLFLGRKYTTPSNSKGTRTPSVYCSCGKNFISSLEYWKHWFSKRPLIGKKSQEEYDKQHICRRLEDLKELLENIEKED